MSQNVRQITSRLEVWSAADGCVAKEQNLQSVRQKVLSANSHTIGTVV